MRAFLLLALSSMAVSGCVEKNERSVVESANDTKPSIESELDDILQRQIYESDEFVLVNQESYHSDLNPSNMIDVYVSSFGYAGYSRISPNEIDDSFSVPEGTVIIRKVWDDKHYFDKYTVMVKAETGYYPEGGDFYYGVMDRFGNYMRDDQGDLIKGKVAECAECHLLQRGDAGFLFGVPTQEQGLSLSLKQQELQAGYDAEVFLKTASNNDRQSVNKSMDLNMPEPIATQLLAVQREQELLAFVHIEGENEFFGVFNADGSVAYNVYREPLSGALTDCMGCHIGAKQPTGSASAHQELVSQQQF